MKRLSTAQLISWGVVIVELLSTDQRNPLIFLSSVNGQVGCIHGACRGFGNTSTAFRRNLQRANGLTPVDIDILQTQPSRFVSSLEHDPDTKLAVRKFDFIVVGGGAAGCVVAATLSGAGFATLLIERGGLPNEGSLTGNIYGAGLVINNRKFTQEVITTQGIRSHIGTALGGGTAVNYGIWIEENDDYYNLINREFRETDAMGRPSSSDVLPLEAIKSAYQWLHRELDIGRAPRREPYGSLLREVFAAEFGRDAGRSSELTKDAIWEASSLFNMKIPRASRQRRSADVLLAPNGSLTVLLATLVERVVTRTASAGEEDPKAVCVQVRRSRRSDSSVIGRIPSAPDLMGAFGRPDDILAASQINAYLESIDLNLALDDLPYPSLREVAIDEGTSSYFICLDDSFESNEIIISAGTILSPLLLMKSGIGPPLEVSKLGVEFVARNEAIGKNLIDRPLVPIVFYSNSEDPMQDLSPEVCESVGWHMQCADDLERGSASSEMNETQFWNLLDSGRCTGDTFEEMSGGRLLEGFLTATRVLLPLGQRTGPIGDAIEETVSECSDLAWDAPDAVPGSGFQFPAEQRDAYYNSIGQGLFPDVRAAIQSRIDEDGKSLRRDRALRNKRSAAPGPSICQMIAPQLECMRRMIGWWYLLSDVRSCGEITIDPMSGKPLINPNYFTHPGDIEAAINGVQKLIEIAKAHNETLSQVLRPNDAIGCPGMDFNGALDAATTSAMRYPPRSTDPFVSAIPSIGTQIDPELLPSVLSGLLSPQVPPSSLPFATFPPAIPDPKDRDRLLRYVGSMSTSMWHWVGSVSLGSALSSGFNVKGVRSLSVIDASVLPRMTRLNPTATVMAVARVAALKKREARSSATS